MVVTEALMVALLRVARRVALVDFLRTYLRNYKFYGHL